MQIVLEQVETSSERMDASALEKPAVSEAQVLQEEAIEFFSGPPSITAPAKHQTNYMVSFKPLYEACIMVCTRMLYFLLFLKIENIEFVLLTSEQYLSFEFSF